VFADRLFIDCGVVIRRGDEWQGTFDFYKHETSYSGFRLAPHCFHPSPSVRVHDLLKEFTVHNDFASAFEAVAFAGKRINNVYLDAGFFRRFVIVPGERMSAKTR
jgi:hypothetical protein